MNSRYTPEEDAKILHFVSLYPHNITLALQHAEEDPIFRGKRTATVLWPRYNRLRKDMNPDRKVKPKPKKKVKTEMVHVPQNGQIKVKPTPHRRQGAVVSLALQFAELAVSRLTYDEKLLLAKTILDSEQ